jgi:hypothetical protein
VLLQWLGRESKREGKRGREREAASEASRKEGGTVVTRKARRKEVGAG